LSHACHVVRVVRRAHPLQKLWIAIKANIQNNTKDKKKIHKK